MDPITGTLNPTSVALRLGRLFEPFEEPSKGRYLFSSSITGAKKV